MSASNTRFEITIPLRKAGKVQAGIFYTTWALMGIGISYCLFELGSLFVKTHPELGGLVLLCQFVVGIVGGLIYVYIPYQVALARAQDPTILINEDGLGLPPSFFGIGAPRWVSWIDVNTIDLGMGLSGKRQLALKGKRQLQAVELSSVSNQDIEQMLLAIEGWAPSVVWSSAVSEYRDQLQLENESSGGVSHTQLFEDELAKRFNAPTFVPLEPGRELRSGTIKVNRQLAFGGFAAIYLAEDSINGTVVLKESVVPASQSEEIRQKASELFAREALLLRGLDHPGIARVFDYFVEDDRSYIVMEHIDGLNLRQVVAQQGRQPDQLVIGWAMAVAEILAYLHDQSPPVVHRDVTPDNLVLTNLGRIKLIDFGASNQYLGNATGTLIGKHAYMPPEQIKGKAEPASDIYALGATMHFLLTGSEPEPLSASRPRTVDTSVCQDLDRLVSRATSLKIEDRILTAGEFQNELSRIAGNSVSGELPVPAGS